MSPLLQALLRANPKQWAAAAEAVASLARASGTAAARGARRHASSVYLSPAFNEVWAEAARFAKASARPRGVAAWRALPRLPRLRAPSQLFVLAHRARELPAVAARLPNFSGALVFLLVGGSNLAPATARCLERRGGGRETRASSASSSPVARSVLVPINAPNVTWVDTLPVGARAFVERALTVLRALHLSVLFAPVLLLAPALLYADGLGLPSGAELWYRMLRKTLELGGAAFIKWGQWASTRYDVFPAKLCRELEELQAGAPEHSWKRTKEILERAYGPEQLGAIFAWMDPSPIASGSIAQIHRARLREGVAESNGAGPYLGIQRRLLRAANAGVELAASGEWRRVLVGALEEWRQSAGKWEWNPGSFVGSAGGNGTETANGDASDSVARDERRESGVTAERADSFFPKSFFRKAGASDATSTSTSRTLGTARGRLDGGPVRRREGASPGRGRGAPARLRHPDVAGERHQGRVVPAAVSARAHRAAVRRAHASAG